MTLRAAEDHYRTEAAVALATARQVDTYWTQVRPDDIGSWRELVLPASTVVAAGQYRAAQQGEGYVATALREQGADVTPDARVDPTAFAGMPNGRLSVLQLLDQPRVQALTAISEGMAPALALASARRSLQTYSLSLVQDAGRQADGVATFARPRIGWVRMVNAPCCKDCAILAGRWYRSNVGFQRHPRCDCRHVPTAEDAPGDVGTDPRALFGTGRVTGLTDDEARALSEGADPSRVVNASRGASADKMTTTEGATRRAQGAVRLTPEGVYRQAGDDRDLALELLRANGYIT